jgi:hypothetical protein
MGKDEAPVAPWTVSPWPAAQASIEARMRKACLKQRDRPV